MGLNHGPHIHLVAIPSYNLSRRRVKIGTRLEVGVVALVIVCDRRQGDSDCKSGGSSGSER